MESKRTYCAYHQNQYITNFCKDKKCLMPLCPSCIGDHSRYHQQNKTKPVYHNIYETLLETQDLLYKSIYNLEDDRKRNYRLMKKTDSLDILIKQKLMQAKNVIYHLIDEAFLDLESAVKTNVMKLHEEIGLYSAKRLQRVEDQLREMLDQLYSINQGLKAQKYLGNMIIFLKDKCQQSTTMHSKMTWQIEQNENYDPRIQINNEAKNTILYNLKKIIRLDDKKELDKRKQKQKEEKTYPKQKIEVKDEHMQKIEKIQRSYTPQKSLAYAASKSSIADLSRSKRTPFINNNGNININSPYRQRSNLTHYQMPSHSDHWMNNRQTSRIRDFKHDFEILSQKVTLMRKENQNIAKSMR